jgi:hypothetical protein
MILPANNPYIGKIKEIKTEHGTRQYIFSACPKCGKSRWLIIVKDKPTDRICAKCQNLTLRKYGKDSPSWKGGFMVNKIGYKFILLAPDDPYWPMRNHCGYVREHRLVMAKHLGRCLEDYEIIHRINSDVTDNRIENLELTPMKYHLLEATVKGHVNRIIEI